MSFTMFDDLWEVTKELPRRQGEQLLYAVTAYAIDGTEPSLSGELRRLFTAYRYRLDASAAASAKGRAMAEARYAKQAREQAAQAPAAADVTAGATACMQRVGKGSKGKGRVDGGGAPAPKRFAPPTAEEVRAYSEERALGIDPERFCDYYAAQGWRLSNGQSMRDWRAAARNWARRDAPKAPEGGDRFDRFDLRVVGGGGA